MPDFEDLPEFGKLEDYLDISNFPYIPDLENFKFPSVDIPYPSIEDIFPSPPDDFYKDFEQIVTENGYRFESHQHVTPDGYILKLFRINGRLEEELIKDENRKVLFF